LRDSKFNRFWLIHPCDGQTDRQTDGQTDRRTKLPWHIRAIATLSRVKINAISKVVGATLSMGLLLDRLLYLTRECSVKTRSADWI